MPVGCGYEQFFVGYVPIPGAPDFPECLGPMNVLSGSKANGSTATCGAVSATIHNHGWTPPIARA